MSCTTSEKYTPMSVSVDDVLGESFIATATAVDMMPSEAHPYLEIVAPATLPEGYTFEAEAKGQRFMVKVPVGGIEEGQKFSVPFPSRSGSELHRSSVPVGHWKDDMCACCTFGCIHPVICNAWCCPLILLGQVLTRLKLTWLAEEGGNAAQMASTFGILFWIGILYWIWLEIIPNFLPLAFTDENGQLLDAYWPVYYCIQSVLWMLIIFRVALTSKARRHIRNKYKIPEQQCHGCEDCCCSFWCGCCTIAQMARHTGDYTAYDAKCCSESGFPPHAPSIDVLPQYPSIV